LGHESVLPLCLGDDGDCIDDDFDQWLSALRTVLAEGVSETRTLDDTILDTNETLMKVASDASSPGPAPPIRSSSSSSSSKYPTLNLLLEPSVDGTTSVPARAHLLDICPSFYKPGSRNFPVSENRLLSHAPTSNGLCELQMHLPDSISYETGDHFVLHPRNADCVVQAFLQAFGVSPDAVITGHDGKGASSSILLSSGLAYPHPTGITVYETLSHCVDLESPPSPSLARLLTGKPNLDYKREIAHPRRTVLELLLQNQETCQSTMSLSDLLWQLPPLQPRYYSIASSAAVHPDVVSLTYRPVQYVTSRGIVRHGVCTSYMRELSGKSEVQSADPSQQPSLVVATIRSNPSFRLPAHPATPIWMIAGGCGVAPIRAFLQERLHRAPMIGKDNYGPAWLFLGFRNPADQVYTDLAQQALAAGAITKSFLSFQMGCESAATDDVSAETASVVGCGLVSEQVRRHGAAFWEHCQAGGVTYLCGGARTFGVAIENEVHAIFQEHGGLSEQEATAYLQELIREGRFSEDLAD
jgi:sulfite reductase alpha subunit-like flavoprotein